MRLSGEFVAALVAASLIVVVCGCGDDDGPGDAGDSFEAIQSDADWPDGTQGEILVDDVQRTDTVLHDTALDSWSDDGQPTETEEPDVETVDAVNDVDLDTDPDTSDKDAELPWPAGVENIDQALDEDFLVPNRGLAMKIITPLLAGYPGDGLEPGDNPWVLKAELLLPSGDTVELSSVPDSFAMLYPIDGYDDSWIFVNVGGPQVESEPVYTLNLYPTVSTLSWMRDGGVTEINGDYAPFVVYRSGWFNDVWVTCPALASTSGTESAMRVHFDVDTLEVGAPIGLMVNSHVTDDRQELVSMYQAGGYEELCECYEVSMGGYEARACTAADIDWYPGAASPVSPRDGAEGVATDILLKWTSPGDPDGGNVLYDVYLGTLDGELEKVLSATGATSFSPVLQPDTIYLWRVDVRDDEGNLTRSRTWAFDTDTVITQLEPHNYLILVDRRLKGAIDDALEQYVTDVTAESGLVPAVRWWMPGDHVMMREIIADSRDNACVGPDDCLVGVFMIGDLPSAWYEQDSDFGGDIGIMHEEFPIELFFQDLDCQWTDADGDGMFDAHGDLDLELFSARLVGGADRIVEYFERLHDYRVNGTFFQPRNFFSFVDDDWNGSNYDGTPDKYTTSQTWGLADIYGDNYIRREWEDDTDKDDYLQVMTSGGAEFVYQWIHSSPQSIYFDDNFSVNPDNILAIDELTGLGVSGSFFNLFDCSISRYTEPAGNMATEYVHSPFGLATIGSTKTGGIFNPDVLHGAMLAGEGVGEALRLWFNDTWLRRDELGLPDPTFDDWWLGMMVQGDPMVLLNPAAVPDRVSRRAVPDSPGASTVFSSAWVDSMHLMMGRRALTTKVQSYREWLQGQAASPNRSGKP